MIEPEVHAVRGCIDHPPVQVEVTPGPLRITGWVLDEAAALRSAVIIAGDQPGVRVRLGLWRPDVGDAFPDVGHAAASGFQCDLDVRAVGPGPLEVTLLASTGAGEWHVAASIEVNVVARGEDRGGTRPRAAFTIVQNEPVMLPLWLDYYGRFFDAEDLYVLNHDGTDGSVEAVSDRCQVIPIHRTKSFEHRWLRATVEAFQTFLLRSYDAVLFTEADEFVVADPRRYSGLDDYIGQLEEPAARCLGFNVVQQPDEPALQFGRPLLAQRRYWHASLGYSKRLLGRVPLRWSEGFHEEYNAPDRAPDPALLLVHLHRIDYDWCVTRHRSTAARNWSEEDIAREDGTQNRMASEEQLAHWFRFGPDLDSPRELIPEHVRSVL